MPNLIKFPSIGQFRHCIRSVADRAQFSGVDENGDPVFDRAIQPPTLPVAGTVKLHGTNAGIWLDPETDKLVVQSHSRIISVENDNQGFARFVADREEQFRALIKGVLPLKPGPPVLYGEFCGKGINSGCAIHQLEKFFMLFGIRYGQEEDTLWADLRNYRGLHSAEDRIFNIAHYPVYAMPINFAAPLKSQNELIEVTLEVEKECPVAKALGASGIGEGVVWKIDHSDYNGPKYWFKVKGEEHNVTKVRKLAEVDVQKIEDAEKFVGAVCTEQRLLQGVAFLKEQSLPISEKSTGNFLRWVSSDVNKEEADTLEASGLTIKDIGRLLSTKARVWYFNNLEE